jgi:hypothetical protein
MVTCESYRLDILQGAGISYYETQALLRAVEISKMWPSYLKVACYNDNLTAVATVQRKFPDAEIVFWHCVGEDARSIGIAHADNLSRNVRSGKHTCAEITQSKIDRLVHKFNLVSNTDTSPEPELAADKRGDNMNTLTRFLHFNEPISAAAVRRAIADKDIYTLGLFCSQVLAMTDNTEKLRVLYEALVGSDCSNIDEFSAHLGMLYGLKTAFKAQ